MSRHRRPGRANRVLAEVLCWLVLLAFLALAVAAACDLVTSHPQPMHVLGPFAGGAR